MSCFVFRSLTPCKNPIRLLQVLPEVHRPSNERSLVQQPENLCPSHPVVSNNVICCTISDVSLEDAPQYTALSYSWGDQTRKREILLNGATISITENLESALRHLRHPYEPLTLWVDAMCINQENDAEKSEQINKMRQIYARALLVTTWLGPAADNSDVAMRWIQRYGEWALKLDIGSRPELQLRHLLEIVDLRGRASVDQQIQTFVEDLKVHLSQEGAEQLLRITALDLLFKRPYWSRVWVVQELVSASKVLFVCGTQTVTEEVLHHSLRLLRNFRRYEILKVGQDTSPSEHQRASLVSIDNHDPIALLKFRRARAAGPFPLVYLLRNLRSFGATDPRDKIFALLGVASDARALGLSPDYRKSCEEVYSEVALALIRSGHYDPLSLKDSSKQIVGLPSWSADWSFRSRRNPLQERSLDRSAVPLAAILEPTFSASGIKSTLGLSERSGGVCSMPRLLRGAVVSTVEQLGMAWGDGDIGLWLQDLDTLSSLATDTFETTEVRQKTVWRTAVADQEIRQGNKKPRLSYEKLSRVHEALRDKDLSLTTVQTLIEAGLGDYYEQLKVVAPGRRPLSMSDGYYGIGPHETQPGDVLVIFLGAQVPHVLRHYSKGNSFRLVGEAYVHGIMDGEAMKEFPDTEMIPLV